MTVSSSIVGQYEPAGQDVQLVVSPREYLPAVQATGAADVVAHEYPGGQGVQATAQPRLYLPDAHAVGDALVLAQEEPAGHGVHAVVAPAVEYVPRLHGCGKGEPGAVHA